jgi:NTP pyrophosphatase (non-canonical NTP hydrolase)
MKTMAKSLNELSKEAYETAKSKGFYEKPVEMGTRLMLIVSELGEALEADRKNRFVPKIDEGEQGILDYVDAQNNEKFKSEYENYIKGSFEEEVADMFIRGFDLCGFLNIDIDKHVALKMRYNSLREHKHGKNY